MLYHTFSIFGHEVGPNPSSTWPECMRSLHLISSLFGPKKNNRFLSSVFVPERSEEQADDVGFLRRKVPASFLRVRRANKPPPIFDIRRRKSEQPLTSLNRQSRNTTFASSWWSLPSTNSHHVLPARLGFRFSAWCLLHRRLVPRSRSCFYSQHWRLVPGRRNPPSVFPPALLAA